MSNSKFTLTTRLKADIDDFKKGLNKAKYNAKKYGKEIDKAFGGTATRITNIGAAIGLTFGARELFTYAKDAVDLSNQISGVEEAFNKLKGVSLEELRKQTKGTASDFQLMKASVKAAEFGIDASKMPQLMEFAAVQANKMGESVDYMVESIVTGLARNSIPILDNLGLSSVMLKEKMKETGDISSAALAVINEKLKESGGLSDNAGVKASQLTASFSNMKAEIGKELTPAFNELFGALKDNLPAIMQQTKTVATFIAQNFELILKLTAGIGALVLALQAAKAAQTAFNLVTKANPYVLLATALIGVAVGLKQISDNAKKAEENYRNFIKSARDKGKTYDSKTTKELGVEYRKLKKEVDAINRSIEKGGAAMTPELESRLKTQKKVYEDNIRLIYDIVKARAEEKKSQSAAVKEQIENLESLEDQVKVLQEQTKTASLEEIGAINDQITALQKKIQLYKDATNEVDNYKASTDKLTGKGQKDLDNQVKIKKRNPNHVGLDQEVNPFKLAKMDDAEPNTAILDYWDELGNRITDTGALVQTFEGSINSLSDTFVQMFATGKVSFEGMVSSMLDGLRQIINGLLAQAIAGMIAQESSSKGVVGLALAAVGVAALQGMWQANVPELANGGVAYGDTLARVGEYSGAKSNPEVIAPLNKLKTILGDTGGVGGEVRFEIEGTKLVGILDKQIKRNGSY